ncbi:MAG: hypothetical protein ACOYNL_04725 [Rickettsiales bacterium]
MIKKMYNKGANQHDLLLVADSLNQGHKYEFRVRRNRVDVKYINDERFSKGKTVDYADWRQGLNEAQKLRVFALILDEYRKHSIGDEHGYRGAVLGVDSSGQIYLGANTATEQVTSPYFKECAEQNMVSAASDLAAYSQVKKRGWDKFSRPKAPVFETVYMMGGVDQANVPVSCPCGKCTDMLAKNMSENGRIYAMPILSSTMHDALDKNSNSKMEIYRGNTLAEVRDKVTRPEGQAELPNAPYRMWQTTISHLNSHRAIPLEEKDQDIADMQRKAYQQLCKEMKNKEGLHEFAATKVAQQALVESARNGNTIKSGWELYRRVLHAATDASVKLEQKLYNILGLRQYDAVAFAAANQFIGRTSIPELDAAGNGKIADISAINRFMRDTIKHIGADRITNDRDARNIWVKTIAKHLPAIRSVVLQLDDGTFHHATECSGQYDASLPNAEATAVATALPSLGSNGIRDVWVMEANGSAIEKGILPTSPKEGVERIIKRASKEGIRFHYIPLNDGNLNAETLTKISRHYNGEQIFPALFKGSRPLECAPPKPTRAWTDFITQNLRPALQASRAS